MGGSKVCHVARARKASAAASLGLLAGLAAARVHLVASQVGEVVEGRRLQRGQLARNRLEHLVHVDRRFGGRLEEDAVDFAREGLGLFPSNLLCTRENEAGRETEGGCKSWTSVLAAREQPLQARRQEQAERQDSGAGTEHAPGDLLGQLCCRTRRW